MLSVEWFDHPAQVSVAYDPVHSFGWVFCYMRLNNSPDPVLLKSSEEQCRSVRLTKTSDYAGQIDGGILVSDGGEAPENAVPDSLQTTPKWSPDSVPDKLF